jgi:hypothetical protein
MSNYKTRAVALLTLGYLAIIQSPVFAHGGDEAPLGTTSEVVGEASTSSPNIILIAVGSTLAAAAVGAAVAYIRKKP